MTVKLSNIINYFHDCYLADNRSISIMNFLKPKVAHKINFEQEELINGKYPIVPIPNEQAEQLLKNAKLFEKEKELVHGSLFVCGTYIDFQGKLQSLCTPLFYHTIRIEKKDDFFFTRIDLKSRRLNYPLLQLLASNDDHDGFKDILLKALPNDTFDFQSISLLAKLFQKHYPHIETTELLGYPKNLSLNQLKYRLRKLKETKNEYQIVPFSAMGIVDKSARTRGVLNELKQLGTITDFSLPLSFLFESSKKSLPEIGKEIQGYVPTILSKAQKNLVLSAANHPTTLIVGPPGTGKTYTISAIALEHMSRGESVLIASRTDEAVDVVAEKINTQLGFEHCIIRGGRKRKHITKVRRFIKSLLLSAFPMRFLHKEFNEHNGFDDLSKLRDALKSLHRQLQKLKIETNKLEGAYDKILGGEKEKSAFLSQKEPKLWDNLKTLWLELENKLAFQGPLDYLITKIMGNDTRSVKKTKEFLKWNYVLNLLLVIQRNWSDFNEFYKALNTHSDTERVAIFEKINFDSILKAFPIWLINLSEIKDKVPLQKELFDVVIIDEATQCDIASCIPAMQRAKRVVFAGDPSQLRHISFLSKDIQFRTQQKLELQAVDTFLLNYRDHSILDLAIHSLQSRSQVAMLDEHYRSLPQIIGFSNQEFYNNELRLMTHKPGRDEQSLFFIATNGKREGNGVNTVEAENLLEDVIDLVRNEAQLDPKLVSSIGILSPFRSQVDHLSQALLHKFNIETLDRHKFKVGTPYAFQGEERDIMYLSMVVDGTTHHSTKQHLNKPDVFNVSITRARHRQYIYYSGSPNDHKPESLFRKYYAYGSRSKSTSYKGKVPAHDVFLKQVQASLPKVAYDKIWEGYKIADITLDLLLRTKSGYYAIDLIGYPGDFVHALSVERIRILNRAQIKIFPVSFVDWYFDQVTVLANIAAFLKT
ncbi:AAA domain-containing protein [Croceitalea sp. P059]|uniref:DEAD/DEAH box helicase n=1 Tax=Croceitalea sp. P059 TaxID=3075601 RepID=UPI0028880981|nr:AAA domain-containing protein [Croceitalea sp. P059]MDT0538432.1 AAA domain-containing protein [Croceitalea sp. P059]